MKISAFVFLFVFCYVQCRKTYTPIDKNANLAFINMEGGGIRPASPKPATAPKLPEPAKPTPQAAIAKPAPTPKPVPSPTVKPNPAPVVQPPKTPNQITPVPVYITPAVKPITTPGPGSVKQLVNFYDSRGKGSNAPPFTYSQAVKQG